MTEESSAEWEMAIVLPLGVVANQLQRLEAQLRLVNMKALDFARARADRGLRALIDARLEQISETLGSITGLVSDIEVDIRPRATHAARTAVKDEAAPLTGEAPIDDLRSSHGGVGAVHPTAKPRPERDD